MTRGRKRRLCKSFRIAVVGLLVGASLINSGCTRAHWRLEADHWSYIILWQKSHAPGAQLPPLEARPVDPRSRFADPYDADKPPLPPDDPAAHAAMHYVYGMKGYKKWHKFGDTATVENPYWLEAYGFDPTVVEANAGRPAQLPEFPRLRLDEAVTLSYIHSRDYQTQVENVFLNALALTLQRFAFDLQFFGLSNRPPSSDITFEQVPHVSKTGLAVTRFGANKLLPTGGQLAVEFLNSTLWFFQSGPEPANATTSILSYSLFQPLFAGGGKRFVLEDLTQSERNVLYAVRNFARYRQGFFVTVVAGTNPVGVNNQPSISNVGSGFTTAGTPTAGGGGGTGGVGGYLGLLQQVQQIYNQRDNIRRTEEQLEILRARASERPDEIAELLPTLPQGLVFPPDVAPFIRYDNEEKLLIWRGLMTDVQFRRLFALSPDPAYQTALQDLFGRSSAETININIAQLATNLANARINLNTSERQLQDGYDQYKILIGLPTDLRLAVDPTLLKQFELIDPQLPDLQNQLTRYIDDWIDIDRDNPNLNDLRAVATGLSGYRDRIEGEGFDVVRDDFRRFEVRLPARIQELPTDDDRARLLRGAERDRRLFRNVRRDFVDASDRLKSLMLELRAKTLPAAARRQAFVRLAELREDLIVIAQGLAVVQIDLRVELLTLNPFSMSLDEVTTAALDNRVDLFNARAQVMDARRKMEVAANLLQATVNIVAEGDIRTRPLAMFNNNPFDFRGDQSSFRTGLSFTTPLQLVQQRNNYRASQVIYEQSRRNYMLTEDQVKQSVRVAWRQLIALQQNFELARLSLRMAALQYDQAVEQTASPVPPAGQPPGLNLLNALNSVLNSQNALINIWVNYETNRLALFRDMGTLELDEQGFWTDEYYQSLKSDIALESVGLAAPLGEIPREPLPGPRLDPGEEPAPEGVVVPPAE